MTGNAARGLTNSNTSGEPLTQEQLRTLAVVNAPNQAIVLVVEDNVANFVLIARLLGYMGIHCEWKTSGYEVVEYADNLPQLDLILLDIRLPYEDGYAALRKIRSSASFKATRSRGCNCRGEFRTNEKSSGSWLRWLPRQTS